MLLRITNTPRSYDWGSLTAIAELLGREPSGEPEAELWLGSHPGSPARLIGDDRFADLAEWARHRIPSGRLPFLLKVLAAASPLSLQAHPTPEQAAEGFARENAAGIPVDAPERNYRDPFSKPELIVALSDTFRALCGFRPVEEVHADLCAVEDARLRPLEELLRDATSPSPAVAWLTAGGPDVQAAVSALVDHAHAVAPEARPRWVQTVSTLQARFPMDVGIAISTLLHTVELGRGEALFLPAGNIHAYLEGLGIELMSASDNVLRGGLTTKHVDVPELLRVLDTTPGPAPLLLPDRSRSGVSTYAPADASFRLAVVAAADQEGVHVDIDDVAIALCLDGAVDLDATSLARGESALITGESVHVLGSGTVAIATGR